MRNSLLIAVLGMAVLAGCSEYEIQHDYDVDSNFNAFKTYAWMPRTVTNASGSATTAIQSNTLLDKRIEGAVDAQMQAKGFVPNQENPDLLVVHHVGLKDKVDVTDWGYTYAGSYWGGGLGRSVDVYQYTEGTLIVDLVNANNKQLVWRGSATGVVEPGRTPEQIEARVNDVVRRIFENYPPKKK
jgi:hypothetical protein